MLNHLHGSTHSESPTGSMQGWANHYDRITRMLFGGSEQRNRAEMISLAGVQPGSVLLDIGCGTGTLTLVAARAAQPGGSVWGIDIASDMVDYARYKAQQTGVPAQFQTGSITELPFTDGQLDIVLSSLMLHHLPDDDTRRRGLAEIQRVLRPGGILMIAEFKPPVSGFLKGLFRMVLGDNMIRIDYLRIVKLLEGLNYQVEVIPARSKFLTYIRATSKA